MDVEGVHFSGFFCFGGNGGGERMLGLKVDLVVGAWW